MKNHSEREIYCRKVFDFLDSIPPGKKYRVEDICKDANRKLFLECLALYTQVYAYCNCRDIQVTDDYSVFYREERVVFPPKRIKKEKSNKKV